MPVRRRKTKRGTKTPSVAVKEVPKDCWPCVHKPEAEVCVDCGHRYGELGICVRPFRNGEGKLLAWTCDRCIARHLRLKSHITYKGDVRVGKRRRRGRPGKR